MDVKDDLQEKLFDAGYEDTVLADGFDEALIGITTDGAAVYNYTAMIAVLTDRDDMDPDEAREYIDFNVIRALPYYDPAPIIVIDIEDIV